MKKIVYLLFCTLFSLSLTSCLESGLDDLPAFEDAEIATMNFEYRWFDETAQQMYVVKLKTTAAIDSEAATVTCDVTVPAAGNNFPEAARALATQSNIVGYCDISTAAVIAPAGDAPKLGAVGDFTGSDMRYTVTAADGTKKTWTVIIQSFTK